MKLLKSFTEEVENLMKKGQNPIERYLLAWECFCKEEVPEGEEKYKNTYKIKGQK